MFGLSSASTRFTEMYMRGNVIIVVNGYLTLWGKPRVRHVGLVLPTGGYRIYPLSLTPKSSITAPLFDRALWYSRVSPKVRREYIINKKNVSGYDEVLCLSSKALKRGLTACLEGLETILTPHHGR